MAESMADQGTVMALLNKVIQDPSQLGAVIKSLPAAYAASFAAAYADSPYHVTLEVALALFIFYIVFLKKTYDPRKRGYGERAPEELSEKEQEQLVREWEPEPLVPAIPKSARANPTAAEVEITRVKGARCWTSDGPSSGLINFGSFDFYGMATRPSILKVSHDVLDKYTLGSCGPRGFYGTFDLHVQLEKRLAEFAGCAESITFSDAVSTPSSALPAFVKRGDVLVVDEGVHDAVLTGVMLSRARVHFFKHNDVVDLERVLREVAAADKRKGVKMSDVRRFIVVEGLYRNIGDVCPFNALMQLREKYCYRVMVDESCSFGVLGNTGRGVSERYGGSPSDIDILTGSMATTMGSVGGFCVGTHEVVDHQRLSAAGYVFSASAPPYTLAAADMALKMLDESPTLVSDLRRVSASAHETVAAIPCFTVISDTESPVLHARLADDVATGDATKDRDTLFAIVDAARNQGVLICSSKYITTVVPRPYTPAPTIRINACVLHTADDLQTLFAALQCAAAEVLGEDAVRGAEMPTVVSTPSAADAEDDAAAAAGSRTPSRRSRRISTRSTSKRR